MKIIASLVTLAFLLVSPASCAQVRGGGSDVVESTDDSPVEQSSKRKLGVSAGIGRQTGLLVAIGSTSLVASFQAPPLYMMKCYCDETTNQYSDTTLQWCTLVGG